MLERITSEFYPMPYEKGLRWKLDIAQGIEILGDVNKLARVFDNLIRNAVNYSYAATEIFLWAQTEDGQVRMSVKLQGKTIPPEKLERIFEQVYRMGCVRGICYRWSRTGTCDCKENCRKRNRKSKNKKCFILIQ